MSADSLEMLFRAFRLPTMAARFAGMIQSAEAQNWGYRKLLLELCEAEAADRRERKRERLLRESGLPSGKTLGTLQEGQLPAKVRRMLPTLLEGGFVERAENLLVFGLPGRGKTHFLAALGRELVLRHAYTIHFTPTYSSWLNQVERWFALLTERALQRGVHRSTRELEQAIRDFLDAHNSAPKPFIWRKTADEIIASVGRHCQRVLGLEGI